jgi:nicotinate-nucleotide pyrophosphorylase (carboxylating)
VKIPAAVIGVLTAALAEDIGHEDLTTSLLVRGESESKALFIAKGSFVVAGFPFVREVFNLLDTGIVFESFFDEGAKVRKGDILASVFGKTEALFSGERLSLNILQRLSGIASLTRQFVDAVKGTNAKILDTRKTTPGLRFLEKYAVRVGGGVNHRFGLFDGILIKDNHIEEVGSVREAVMRAKAAHHLSRIEVEVENLKELQEAIKSGADVVMLDNMSIPDMREAVATAAGKVTIEASGNITLRNVREIAEAGVDFISVGALTHSAAAADISMKIVK